MIKHPDGRLEGTPTEIAEYQQLMDGQTNRVPVQSVPAIPNWPSLVTYPQTTWIVTADTRTGSDGTTSGGTQSPFAFTN